MYIVIAIIIFGLLITIHELGHFLAARACGVRVDEFAIGMGPVLLKKLGKPDKQAGQTLYSLRAFPIGGFCAMAEDEDSEDPNAFVNKSWWKRTIILVSGAGMNFLAGFIVLLFIVNGSTYFVSPVVTSFYEDCPYVGENALQPNDEIYEIDGHRIYFKSNVSFYLDRQGGDVHDIVVIRDGEKVQLDDFKLTRLNYTIDGQEYQLFGFRFEDKPGGISDTLKFSWYGSLDFVRMVWLGLSDLVSGGVGLKDLSGPVGIVNIINDVGTASETTAQAAFSISYLAAFIAINLAVMNLLPIPALDGGRIAFLLVNTVVEKTTKRKLNPKYEGYIHGAFLIALFALMAFVMFNDIYNIFV